MKSLQLKSSLREHLVNISKCPLYILTSTKKKKQYKDVEKHDELYQESAITALIDILTTGTRRDRVKFSTIKALTNLVVKGN